MKLRQFMVSSLPRMRSKKKKQQQQQQQQQQTSSNQVLNNEHYDRNSNHCAADTPIESPQHDIAIVKNVCFGGVQDSASATDKCQVIDSSDLVNFNVSIEPHDSKCTCCSRICPSDVEKRDNAVDGEEKQCNTLPKTRSRIKTNPWLPSPKPTPSTSPTYSSSSSSSFVHSPLTSPRGMRPSFAYAEPGSTGIQLSDGYLDRPAERTWTRKFVLTNLECLRSRAFCVSDSDEQSPTTEKSEPLEEDGGYFEHRISFEYEEALDSLLEEEFDHRGRRCSSIQDLLAEDGARKDKQARCSSDSRCCYQDDSCDEGTVDVMDDSACMCSTLSSDRVDFRELTDTGYSSLSFDSQTEIDRDFEYLSAGDAESQDDECFRADEHPSANAESGSRTGQDEGKENPRTLNQIRGSLEEKVSRLRQEKLIVEQKIREAKEEEKTRMQEKKKFQRQVVVHRKQMLLQTLRDLKERLENQSSRLQNSYSAVLSMQRRFAQRRSPLLLFAASGS